LVDFVKCPCNCCDGVTQILTFVVVVVVVVVAVGGGQWVVVVATMSAALQVLMCGFLEWESPHLQCRQSFFSLETTESSYRI